MATYAKVPKDIPSSQRSTEITLVAAGDRIDLEEILGRPARRVQFHVGDVADQVSFRLNSRRRMRSSSTDNLTTASRVYGSYGSNTVDVWSKAEGVPVFEGTGSLVIETAEGLQVSTVEIEALSLGTGTTITIVAW